VCDTAVVSYSAQVVPILAAKCYSCHAVATNVAQSPFETYATLQDYIDGALVNSLKGTGGYEAMPPSGALSACDIEKIEAWVKAGAPNN
jgi:cytochrome c5